MSKWVSPGPRLFLITLLVLLTSILVEIQTFAIERADSINGRNKNARIISTRTTTHVRTTNRIPGKREITKPFMVDAKVTTEDIRFEKDDVVKQPAMDNVNVLTVEMTSKKPSMKGTTQSNIFSVPTRRPKQSLVMRPSTPASLPKASTAAVVASSMTAASAANAAHDQRAHTDQEELSMIDLEDNLDTRQEQAYKNNIRKIYKSTNTKGMLTTKDSERDILLSTENYSSSSNSDKNGNAGQSSSSHIYKVNSNYKRYKKLNIVPSKPLWRDPNDNSWRNESISSLGIKFTPKINATNVFQLKKKELSELDTPMPETENSTNPGLRERLEKLSEIRKSKKKLNATSSMESAEDDFNYEQESSDYPSSRSPTYALPPFHLPTPPPFPPSSPPAPTSPPRRVRVMSTTTHQPDDAQIIKDKKHEHGYSDAQSVFANSDNHTKAQMLPVNITENLDSTKYSERKNELVTKDTMSKNYEKVIANSNYYHTQDKTNKNNREYSTTANPKPNQFDYNVDSDINNNYEYEDYELKLSSDVMNSSETWSERKASTELSQLSPTETTSINQFTNILDSLTAYLNTDKYSTTPTYLKRDNEEMDVSRMKQLRNDDFTKPTVSEMALNFTNSIDLPIGPRNKDRINLPQSYSYNTIPHNKMFIRYNTTIIHHTTQENSNIYNTPAVTEPMHIQTERGGHVPNWEPNLQRISNIPIEHPEPYSNTMPQYIVGQHLDDILKKDAMLRISFPGIMLQNPANNHPAVRNVVNIVAIPANINHYAPPREIVTKLGSQHDAADCNESTLLQ